MDTTAIRSFHKLSLVTLIAVYFLVLVGSVVRTTGSGMGCPDWPKCFGNWVPPTTVEQLPDDYRERYASLREKKKIKFEKFLAAIGMEETAIAMKANSSSEEEVFNPTKTWIEYLNRLVGVAIGLLIIAVAWKGRRFYKSDPGIFWMAIGTLAVVIFQGWFGSLVVVTNLTTWTITVHMFLALLVIFMLTWLYHRTDLNAKPITGIDRRLVWLSLVVLAVQVFFGTEVRQAIDRLNALLVARGEWLEKASGVFVTHRSFSWLVLILHGILFLKIGKTEGGKPLTLFLLVLILGTFFTGAGMSYLAVPAVLQPIHLLLATMALGAEVLLVLRLSPVQKATAV